MATPMLPMYPVEPELVVSTFRPNGSCTYRNAAWKEVFGEDTWERLAEEDQIVANRHVSEASGGLLVTNQIFLVPVPDREEPLPVLLSFVPVLIPPEGAETRYAVNVIGELLTEPATWMASQTQRHRMETLGRMTMGIAHDFNNLLSGILGHAELMKRIALDFDDDGGSTEHLNTIEQAALDGAALVRRIQQYIRQEKLTSFEAVDLVSVIEDSVVLTRPYWYNEPRRKGIAIETKLVLDPIPPINGAPSELRDVFVNLILNAVQAMPQGGDIIIRTTCDDTDRVTVTVSDTGIGMSDGVKARIFEPLFTTKGKRGTGMGLAVCYGTIQEHDGDIAVESEPGYGTTFTITFPVGNVAFEVAPDEQEQPAGKSAKILVVDDEQMVRAVIARLLALKGHEVHQASSGPQALDIIQRETFDLIFTDQGMPEMSGRKLATLVRDSFPSLPIVLLSGDTEVGEADRFVNQVLKKPFRLDDLETTIQEILGENGP